MVIQVLFWYIIIHFALIIAWFVKLTWKWALTQGFAEHLIPFCNEVNKSNNI